MPDPTPGEVAHAAYAALMNAYVHAMTGGRLVSWQTLPMPQRAAWHAAAQAVLAWPPAPHPGTAGWLKTHLPTPLTDAARAALEATLEAFAEDQTPPQEDPDA